MKLIFFIFFSSFFSFYVTAQNKIIEEIKKQYSEVTENTDNFNIHNFEMNFVLPAVGQKTKKIKFYHTSMQNNPEEDPYDMSYNVLKIDVSWNISDHSFFNVEYLFDFYGNLIFYFKKEDGKYETFQKRYYYNNGNLIKCIIKTKSEEGKVVNYTKTSSFSKTDISNSKIGIKKSKEYLTFFDIANKIDAIDK